MTSPSQRICIDRVVPENLHPARSEAHKAAMSQLVRSINENLDAERSSTALQQSSKARIVQLLRADEPAGVARMAVINLKKWDNGKELRCKFLDGDEKQQANVSKYAKLWQTSANVTLSFVDDPDAEIRISFQADPGSWSAIGTDCLISSYFPSHQPTMNFGWLTDDTEDQEYERVVVHEFGHALGCIHEHQQPNETLHWKVDAVYAAFSGPPNYWDRATIEHNILEKYSPEGLSATRFDEKSIMLYQFDGSLFEDGLPTPLNYELSDEDKQMIGSMYPREASVSLRPAS